MTNRHERKAWKLGQMKRILLIASLLVAASAQAENLNTALANCYTARGAMADKARLDCYDKVVAQVVHENSPAPGSAKGYQTIAIADLKVDAKEMAGKRVAVRALIQTMGEISMLKSDELDMAPLWANVDKLPREDRKKLLNGCQVVLCDGEFSGVMQKAPMGMTLIVDSVAWR